MKSFILCLFLLLANSFFLEADAPNYINSSKIIKNHQSYVLSVESIGVNKGHFAETTVSRRLLPISWTIWGKVTDNGQGLPGVTVRVRGTTIGTATDVNGYFSILVPEFPIVLIISFVGYTSKEVLVNGPGFYNIDLGVDDPPVFSLGYPKIPAITADGFTIELQISESGKVYYVLVPDGETPPTPLQVKAGIDANNNPALQKGIMDITVSYTLFSQKVTGLPDSKNFDVYLVAEDLSYKLQNVVKKLDVSTNDKTSPSIILDPILESISFNAIPNLSFKVSDNISLGEIRVSWVGLSKDPSTLEKIDIAPSTGVDHTYTVDLPALTDEVGIHYTIQAIDAAGNSKELSGKIAVHHPEGMNIKNFNAYGDKTEDYELISIPLQLNQDQKKAEVVLNELGKYDDTKWRLFQYRNLSADSTEDAYEEYGEGFTDIEPGRGYWLLVRKNESILNTGAGTTLANAADPDKPFSVTLQPGFNLIGNPYSFKLSWEDIINDPRNNKAIINQFNTYQNGIPVENATILEAFEGAFVFAAKKTTLYFPTKKNLSINTSRRKFTPENKDDTQWLLKLTYQAGVEQYTIGGVGMQPGASLSKDAYDDITLPKFLKWAEINFNHPEYFYPNFSQDIVPPADNYVWEFTTQSNVTADVYQLKWDKSSLAFSTKSFVLYDVDNQVVIDMKLRGYYSFSAKGSRKFKIYYGSKSFINDKLLPEKILLGKSYPNPFTQTTTIPFSISSNQPVHTTIIIYDGTGRKIMKLFEGTTTVGFNSVKWDGCNELGARMPAGIYLCKMAVITAKGKKEFAEKLVLMDK